MKNTSSRTGTVGTAFQPFLGIRNVPTALSRVESAALHRLTHGKRVVEAGALLGYSTLVIASGAVEVISIDRHDGYSGSTWNRYRSNLLRFAPGNVNAIKGDCLLELPHHSVEVAFLDLTGERDLTLAALNALHPIVGLTLIHDVNRVHCDGVMEAIRASRWQLIEAVDTLGVLIPK